MVPIPAPIADLWKVIEEETQMVHAYWLVFTQLFMGPAEQMDLLDRLVPIYDNFRTASVPVRELRNKVIAHFDLPTATKTVPPPKEATVQEVRAALAEFMNAVAMHFSEAPTAYGAFGMMGS
ncbi:MAG TPA: hypothetical protein VHD85_11745 [Terracidiphilus sp.]|jgi:N-acyl-D-aspartate/D-glutamate deacylase|nr:hypothetical protein [Terracidiphilus sp.]